MRLLWIHQHFSTPEGCGSQRAFEFGRRFAAAGHEVNVLCGAAYDTALAGRRRMHIAGMELWISRTRYCQQMGFTARMAAFLQFTCFSLLHVLRHGKSYDLVIASSGPLTTTVPALLARWLWACPYVFEVLDVWPDAAIEAGMLRNRVLQRLAFDLEAQAYCYAARIVTCSDGMTERLRRKGVPKGKIATIPHGTDPDLFAPDAARRCAVRHSFGVRDDQTVVLYAGAMGRTNALEDVARTMAQTADDRRLVWWFAGDGACAGVLREAAQVLPSVHFFGHVPHTRIVDLHLAADVALVSFMHAPLFYENSPNKAFDALAAGLPLLFNRTTWMALWLAEYACGYVVNTESPATEMARVLKVWAGDPELRCRMGERARRLACDVFDRERLADAYLREIEQSRSVRPARAT